jgi:hypothetical protein
VTEYGSAILHTHDDGHTTVDHADDVIGIATVLLDSDINRVDSNGNIMLAGDPEYTYQPVQFASAGDSTLPQILVLQRVPGDLPRQFGTAWLKTSNEGDN